MKASSEIWKEELKGEIREDWSREIDIFETEIFLRKQNKIEERVFAETRLRRGAYGQRYDNGQRNNGVETQILGYDLAKPTKGANTQWDAPGMQRIKVPYGGLNADQLEVVADLAEEYSDGIAHITTRQDFQLHYIHIEDTPSVLRRLAAVGITTREACGNSVRNVTACPFVGVCPDESFDITPYAHALTFFLLGHPDVQDFGRKFKPAFSGCKQHACGLTNFHDLGLIATKRSVNGKTEFGFEMYVGGGLGAVPHHAKLLSDFVTPEELLPMTQAISRVFARLGEKKNRNRARIKFLVKDLGIEKFTELVLEERKKLPYDPRWTEYLKTLDQFQEKPKNAAGDLPNYVGSEKFNRWLKTNIRPQKQEGYVTVTIALPLGDITPDQLRGLADIVRQFTHETIRTTVEQNFVIRWISKKDLPALFEALDVFSLAEPEASHILDVVACPATDTCKLGISSSRGLAAELRKQLAEKNFKMDEAIKSLHIKVSGCFNSCGQQHVADLGFYGVSRKVNGYMVPHFQVVLGGQWENNGGSYGLPIVAVPSKNIPAVVDKMTDFYLKDRLAEESFLDFTKRIGKVAIKQQLDELTKVPDYQSDKSYYSDWGDPREFSTGDIGVGECAGEIVSLVEFDLNAAERELFEAQVLLDAGKTQEAGDKAYWGMLHAAKGLVKAEFLDVTENSSAIVQEFRKRYFDTEKFFDPFMGGKFAQYLFMAHQKEGQKFDEESAHQMIEEAQLFIEASHSCYNRMGSQAAPAAGVKLEAAPSTEQAKS